MVTMGMVIVAGHLIVDPDERDAYLNGCREVVELARWIDGCLDFAINADLVDPSRDQHQRAVGEHGRCRGLPWRRTLRRANRPRSGPASVAEYGAVEERVLTD